MTLPANAVSIPTFSPRIAIITAITQAEFPFVTCSTNITFIVGQSVKIIIPPAMKATAIQPAYDYGMHEINNLIGNIIATPSNSPTMFQIDIDTRLFAPFTLPAHPSQFAQAVPYGENAFQFDGAWRNILPPV